MTEILVRANDKLKDAEATPHLSHSRIQKYLTCPEQYRLYYIERLRAKVESANLSFGALVHLALAEHFRRKADPVAVFQKEWDALQSVELRFSRKDSWQTLRGKGEKLLQKFCAEHAQKIGRVISVEKVFELGLSNLSLAFIGIIDLVAEIDGRQTVVEFKTAAADYEEHEVALMDQLSAYQLAEPEAEQLTVCVFTKTKTPRIEWHAAQRTPGQVMEYLEKVSIVAQQIEDRIFYKRSGKWCRQCDYLPMCLGNKKTVRETLVQIA
jgi:CRISPR/Cas system-associated exonuclease Cas4 (RecB family)